MSDWKCLQCGEPTGNVRSYCAVCQQTQLFSSMITSQSAQYTGPVTYVPATHFDPKNPWHWVRDFFKLLVALPLVVVGLFSVYFCASIIWACIKVVL